MLVLCSAGRSLAADGGSVAPSLEVRGDDACLQEVPVALRLEHWLRGHSWNPAARVALESAADTVRFVVDVPGAASSERAFTALPRDCAQRVDAVALAIAIALDEPVPAVPVAAEVDTPARFSLSLGAGVVTQAVLGPVFAPELGVGMRFAPLAVEAALSVSSASDMQFSGGRASTRLASLQLRVCGELRVWSLWLFGCAGSRFGAALASGRGFVESYDVTLPWIAPLVRLGVRAVLARSLWLQIAGDGFLNALQPVVRTLHEGAPSQQLALGPLGAGGALEVVYAWP